MFDRYGYGYISRYIVETYFVELPVNFHSSFPGQLSG